MPPFLRWLPYVALALTVVLGPATILAHGGDGEGVDALDLTNQAIAFLRAEPSDRAAATERIDDALQAEEAPDDVDLRLVEAASIALDQGAASEAIRLLERAAGIEGEPLGPLVTVSLGAGTYLAFAVAALLVGLGAFEHGVRRGRRVRPTASTGAAHD